MNHRDPERGEPDLDDMLRALAQDDAQAKAPAHLHDAVLAAWDAEHAATEVRAGIWAGLKAGPYDDRAAAPWLARWRGQMAAAAAAVIAVSWLVAHFTAGRAPLDASRREGATGDGRVYFAPTGDAAMSALVGEPALDTESLQIVRVRMPRGALRAFGVALLDPDATSDVEVDVLVGDDGFPRSIQRVRPMPDAAQERRP
jgi:hypothetical protein